MSFTEKQIVVNFDLANGSFGSGKNNRATISGLRCSAIIDATGGASSSTMNLSIWGLPLSLMNQLSTVGSQLNARYNNAITVEAGDADTATTRVFGGRIFNAFVDGNSQPNVAFRVQATPGTFAAVKPAPPLTVRGSADAAGMMGNLAKQMGFAFENNGVNVKLSNPYFGGTAWTQAMAIARHGNFDLIYEPNKMVISPRGQPRQGDAILISPDTGLVGYPMFNQNIVIVRCLFNPDVKQLSLVEVKSDLTPANGKWQVLSIIYELDSQVPNGKWFMTLELITVGTQ
ncbi:hypothetical protein [Rhizobium sp. NXC24]|uniref:baseplate hub protein n=1 Tax=Rhizobium sp. NXC24 TaxID=2048897 RepID=UPI000CDF4875|nr:hypothetical protein [Rhizobium sp. NXC24]AVA21597.1 hypothetical protein NXC24_CH01958 [Rhizobium sp. NXC24]